MSLTAKQRELLMFIADYKAGNRGATPSYKQMRDYLGVKSRSTVHEHVNQLEERGYIRRRKARGYNAVKITIRRLMPAKPKQEEPIIPVKRGKTPMSTVNSLIATMRPKIDSARPICAHGEPVKNLPELWTWGGKRA